MGNYLKNDQFLKKNSQIFPIRATGRMRCVSLEHVLTKGGFEGIINIFQYFLTYRIYAEFMERSGFGTEQSQISCC